ncbi:MAG: 4Fe-4S cluster-binding domain-containing protein, partial [Negativicutes bacterium]|nr:4Fe-4S cluster-binding domain-containing protein [Negativicutes bacterium]
MNGAYHSLPYLEFHITDHCNLNCKSCTHFAPLSAENYLYTDSFIKDITRLSELFTNISRMRILGGEPLLHPQVNLFLEFSRSFFPNSKISLVTNGILLPSMDLSFYQALKANNISLDITVYPIAKDDMTSKVLLASRYDIPIEYQNVEYFCRFLNETGDSDKNEAHNQCWINYCTFLRE